MPKLLIFIIVILYSVSYNYSLERRPSITRAQLRMPDQQPQDEKKSYDESFARSGINKILEYTPMCAMGSVMFLNALYQFSNFENKCWVQPPQITSEECDLWKQLCMGYLMCEVSIIRMNPGCDDLWESEICTDEQCCRECCTLCKEECCSLLGIGRNT